MSFSEKYKNIYNVVGDDVNRVCEEILTRIRDAQNIKPQLQNFFTSPSKHIRAVVSFLYLKANGIEITTEQIVYQAVIELIHNGSLIHDDVIDSSDIRRGNKSFNAKFGEHLSVIAGDYVLSYALKMIAELKSFELLEMFADTFSKMCEGEISQHFSKYQIPNIDEYIEKSYNKTGALFETALCGAEQIALGKISDNTREFAKNFGIAFQIKNDIKNIITNCPDCDIANGIYTAPVIFAGNTENLSTGIEKAKSLLDTYVCMAEQQILELPENIYKQSIMRLLGIIRDE